MTDSQRRLLWPMIAVFAIVALVSVVLWFEFFRVPILPEGQAELAASRMIVRLKAVDVLSDLVKLFLNWTIGLLGLTVYIAKSVSEKGVSLNTNAFVLLALTTTSLLLAIFIGHLALNRIAEVLMAGLVLPIDRELEFLVRAQYGIVTIGTLFLLVLSFELFVHKRPTIPARFALRQKQNGK